MAAVATSLAFLAPMLWPVGGILCGLYTLLVVGDTAMFLGSGFRLERRLVVILNDLKELAEGKPVRAMIAAGVATTVAMMALGSWAWAAIRRGLVAADVDPGRIWVDDQARITMENTANVASFVPSIEASTGVPLSALTVVAEPYQGARSMRLFAVTDAFADTPLRFAPARRESLHPLQVRDYDRTPSPATQRLVDKGVVTMDQVANLTRMVDEKRKVLLGC